MAQIRYLFKIFSKSASNFFFIFHMELKGNVGYNTPKTAYSGKFLFLSYGLETLWNRAHISHFLIAYVSITSKANRNLFQFSESSNLLIWKRYRTDFAISPPSSRKLSSKFGPEKVPKTFFRFYQVWVVRFCSKCTHY